MFRWKQVKFWNRVSSIEHGSFHFNGSVDSLKSMFMAPLTLFTELLSNLLTVTLMFFKIMHLR